MKSKEFTEFEVQWPDKNKWIIVTNNIEAKNAHGEMSHIWLTTFCTFSEDEDCIVTFDAADRKIRFLSHWKYA